MGALNGLWAYCTHEYGAGLMIGGTDLVPAAEAW